MGTVWVSLECVLIERNVTGIATILAWATEYISTYVLLKDANRNANYGEQFSQSYKFWRRGT